MSKHTAPKAKAATAAPEGVRLGGPGTRSKNPIKYDKNAHLGKAARDARGKANN